MADKSNENPFEIESQRAYVVYNPESGAIVHVHRVTTFRGATSRSQDEEEKRAINFARQFGQPVEGVRVLKVDPEEVTSETAQCVDVQHQRLVPESQSRKPQSAD